MTVAYCSLAVSTLPQVFSDSAVCVCSGCSSKQSNKSSIEPSMCVLVLLCQLRWRSTRGNNFLVCKIRSRFSFFCYVGVEGGKVIIVKLAVVANVTNMAARTLLTC